MRAMGMAAMQVLGRGQRLDEQPVDGFVWSVFQGESGEVDLLVPELEEPVVSGQRFNGLRVERDVRLPGPLRQPLVEFAWRHG